MGIVKKAKAIKSKCKETKPVSSTKIVLKKITTEDLKNTRIASYEYIL